jgi:uncharacterized surface protein with fasciclin (FAS1) repeats
MVGSTLFAPTNAAFEMLGPQINAFLFSQAGKKYLKALLEYHVVPNKTLYSTVFYNHSKKTSEDENTTFTAQESEFERMHHCASDPECAEKTCSPHHTHLDLPTLLEGRSLAINVIRHGPFVDLHINHFTQVAHLDGLAMDGVVHFLDSVLIPPMEPHSQGHKAEHWTGEQLALDDFKRRFDGIVRGKSSPESPELIAQVNNKWEI